MKRLRHAVLPLALALALAAALTACGTATVSKAEIEKQAQGFFDKVAQQNGQASFPKITCDGDLEAKKGETTRCSATGPDGTLGITVTVNEVDGDTARLGFKADDELTN